MESFDLHHPWNQTITKAKGAKSIPQSSFHVVLFDAPNKIKIKIKKLSRVERTYTLSSNQSHRNSQPPELLFCS
jgi:hypothetical protein